jgi:hypothetical protein
MKTIPLLLIALCALFLFAACDEEPEPVEEDIYEILSPTLSQTEYNLGDTLTLDFTVANPSLDEEIGEYRLIEQLEIYDADDADSIAFADGAIEELLDRAEPITFHNEISLNEPYFWPGEFELQITTFDKVAGNRQATATLTFTILAQHLPAGVEPTPLPE